MDTNNNVSPLSPAEIQERQNEAAGLAALKKSLEAQGKQSVSLLDAVSQAPSVPANLPDYLGRNVDTTA